MISADAALGRVLALLRPTGAETVSLRQAVGRVLAESLHARRSQPPFAASAMDGYAVRHADAQPGARLKIIGEAAAGHGFSGQVNTGEAARIFTGAPLPAGADRVVIQEDVTRDGDILVLGQIGAQDNVRPRGADFAEGDPIAAPRRLRPADLALIAAMNHDRLRVARRPVVALVATGDELVMPGEAPGPDQIIASNSFGLMALLQAQGAEVQMLPIAADRPEALEGVLTLAADADLIVTIGGASVGEHDLVRDVAGAMGLELAFYKIAMRPGKPLMAGTLRGTPMIGLPGNPVSAMVCGNLFLRPAIDAMLGLPAGPLPRMRARLAAPVPANGPREHFMRARRLPGQDLPQVEPFDRQDSALLGVLAAADCLLVRPLGDGARAVGDIVEIIDI